MTHPHSASDRPWTEQDLLVIDFETTGLKADKDMPIEVGAVMFRGPSIIIEWCTFIDPGRPIPEKITKLTGIEDHHVEGAPKPREAFDMLLEQIPYGQAYPVAYNATFDKPWWFKHLRATSRQIPLLNPEWTWLDPMVMSRHFDPEPAKMWAKGRHKLETSAKRWEVEMEVAHQAVGDCKMTGRLLWAMKDKLPRCTIEELLKKQEVRRQEQDRRAPWNRR